jgi:hypothetical protein
MPETSKPKIYVDSCAFVDLAKFEAKLIGGPESRKAERERDVWHVKRLLEASKSGAVRILTSVVTIVECIHIGGNGQPIPPQRPKGFFLSCLPPAVPVFHSFNRLGRS